jgi:hypothetical protein
MQKLLCTMIALSLLLVTQMTSYAAPPPVDGFVGVPWGASRQQVAAAMAEKGFILLEQRADGSIDKYQGTFAGQPAELEFWYEKNVFYRGEAAFLHVKDKDFYVVKAYYIELRDLLTAKYGSPREVTSIGSKPISYSIWEHLSATATPPGRVAIQVREGPALFGTGPSLGNNLYQAHSVIVVYDIGASWARIKDVKDI